VVSWARLNAERFRGENDYEQRFADAARTAITRQGGGTTHWGRNVLSWLGSTAPRPAVLRYEELIADPTGSLRRVVAEVLPELEAVDGASVPSFEELRKLDGGFFRKGTTGTHRSELPGALHDLFWQRSENVEAMELLGYAR
jgi:hypothetical protein